ncbi:hypothetical protein NEIRO03_0700 [Nematocida sp. AWRm78]|nr:hypothetical protein NEIRO02_0906 [Nematocida sp. AWRm79]KAI5183076.1 hypothetical protein NEIRO03_0700 [Nematocida sp. AWRm78]
MILGSIIYQLFMLNIVCGTLNLSDLREAQLQTLSQSNGDPLTINPDGPLNLLQGFICAKNSLLYNKRFFSPEIDAKYTLTKRRADSQFLDFKRTKEEDDAYDFKYTSDFVKRAYLMSYHRTLINMFPYIQDNDPIKSSKMNGFAEFLSSPMIKEHSYHILASLLILSEGVSLPIYFSEKKKILKLKKYIMKKKIIL